jgi:putative ABC transport system substrate-binding protein
MRRREFIALFGGTAAAWPLAARAQQASPLRRIGVLMLYPENDREGQLRATAFRQGLQKLGWEVGRNIQIDYLWGLGDADWIRSAAAQLLRLAPDVILANGTPAAGSCSSRAARFRSFSSPAAIPFWMVWRRA